MESDSSDAHASPADMVGNEQLSPESSEAKHTIKKSDTEELTPLPIDVGAVDRIDDAGIAKSIVVEELQNQHERKPNCARTTVSRESCTLANQGSAAAQRQCTPTDSKESTLLALPLDSLHGIASFLTPLEWSELGRASKCTRRVCREIVRRVRLHGFRCASELVTAWKLGHLADAKELAALYIQAGVPIYPRSLGHSYHTISWRMGVEVKEIEEKELAESVVDGHPGTESSSVEAFYKDRTEFRRRGGYGHRVTYLSEKGLYHVDKKATATSARGFSVLNPPRRSPSPNLDRRGFGDVSTRNSRLLNAAASPTLTTKVPISIHEHLLAQHALGRSFVQDNNGVLITPSVSLSADFFHPLSRFCLNQKSGRTQLMSVLLSEEEADEDAARRSVDPWSNASQMEEPLPPDDVLLEPGEQEDVNGLAFHRFLEDMEVDLDNRDSLLEPRHPLSRAKLNEILQCVELEVYSSSLTGLTQKESAVGSLEIQKHLRTRFATYQRRLEVFLSQNDHSAFDECILDFWDEFFPHSAGIHYYDRNTPVPRIGSLKKFLTSPCPKAIGVVQCEIERLKITTRGKGVNVKGRLFPTYEYRLFIRNRPHSSADGEGTDENAMARRDTLLMVAKNRGRKHSEASVAVPASATNKKGSNNYYLYLPQQSDVDDHFNRVNDASKPAKLNPNGASSDPVLVSSESSSVLLGRLQSNFIGTEFQIFTPHLKKKHHRHRSDVPLSHYSEDELDYDSGVSSDNTASRRSRFSRFTLHRSPHNSGITDHASIHSELSSIPDQSPPSSSGRERASYPVQRTASCPELLLAGRHARTSRRAIANTPTPKFEEPSLYEEEDGVITYTANLLGSRPRIMDVCVPRVGLDGIPGREWRNFLEQSDDADGGGGDGGRMLHCFRLLQQRLLAEAPFLEPVPALAPAAMGGERVVVPPAEARGDVAVDLEEAGFGAPEDFGLLALQNRPPWWNVELGSFVLNFGGRVSVASVKNFQLCERTNHERIMLQFGRIQGRHSFTMDFQHPLSAVQAFSIAISSLQSKISFG